MNFLPSLRTQLFQPVSAASLAVFRFCFGAVLFWEAYRFYDKGWIEAYYIKPEVFFPYEWFSFLAPLPGNLMYGVFFVMGVAAIGVAIGYKFRLCAIALFATYTYTFLLDQTHFNNHYYLICLLSFLLIWVDAHRWGSVDRLKSPKLDSPFVPAWQLWIFRVQLLIVFFYGGIAKFNPDWLAGEPMRMWLVDFAENGKIPAWLATEPAVWTYVWGGLIFDLAIGPLLLWSRTRKLAIFAVILFNLNNAWMFNIGVFPALLSGTLILFCRPDAPLRFLAPNEQPQPSPAPDFRGRRKLVLGLAAAWVVIQLIFPLRHLLIPGDANWTDEGQEFAWRMKLRDKTARLEITVTDPASGREWRHDPRERLSKRQYWQMSKRPDMILAYVRNLEQQLLARGIENPEIRVGAWASLNGRAYQRLIRPDVDLTNATKPIFGSADWIVPLEVQLHPEPEKTSSGRRPIVDLFRNAKPVHTGAPANSN